MNTPALLTVPHSDSLTKVLARLKTRAYLVGGAIRCAWLQQDNTDYDFAIPRHALGVARSFARAIRGAFVLLDKERGCARVARKEQGRLLTFDFADFRASSIGKDLAQRDFTINTLAIDFHDLKGAASWMKAVMDLQGGLRDLRRRRIAMVSSQAFAQDPLRLLRAFSLQANLGFSIDPETLRQIKKDKLLLAQVARERVRDELFKILSSPRAFKGLRALHAVGLLEQVIPQMSLMYHFPQGGYHHLSLLAHSFETVRQLEKIFEEFRQEAQIKAYLEEPLASGRSRQSLMKMAALLHDIGKPQTRRREKGKITFHGHEHVGRAIIRPMTKWLKMAAVERHALEDMVLYHLRPGYLSNFKSPSPRARFRFFRDTKKEAVSVILLSLADQRSTRGPLTTRKALEHHECIGRGLLAQYFESTHKVKPARLITGHDLIRKLRLTPSPAFKRILAAVEEQQALGKIATAQDALQLAKSLAQKERR